MTPFGIRRALRAGVATGLRLLADRVRPDEVVFHTEGSVEASPYRMCDPEPAGAEKASSTAEPVEAPASEADLDEAAAAMALMAGLSGDMGPAISARVHEEREAGGDDPLHGAIVEALHTIYDPEIPVDIYELGLIYRVDVRGDGSVGVTMTLTSPNCPAAQDLPAEVQSKVTAVEGVERTDVDVVFDPPWTPDLMSDEAKLELNMM